MVNACYILNTEDYNILVELLNDVKRSVVEHAIYNDELHEKIKLAKFVLGLEFE